MGDEMGLEITDLSRSVSFVLCRLCGQRHGSVYFPLLCVVVLPQISISMIRSKTNCSSIKIGWTHVWKKEPLVFVSSHAHKLLCFTSFLHKNSLALFYFYSMQCLRFTLRNRRATSRRTRNQWIPLGKDALHDLRSCMNMFFPFLFFSFLI